MTVNRREFLPFLLSDFLLYHDEIKIVDESSNLPSFVKQSVEVEKIGPQTYGIRYLFFGRIIEHILSFDHDEPSVKRGLTDGHPYDEAHTNLYIDHCGFNGQRNIYGGPCRGVVPVKNPLCNLQILKITKENMDILSAIKEEIGQFESYDMIQQGILDGGFDLYAAMDGAKCAAYLHIHACYDPNVGKKIVSPTIYTRESERQKGVATELLSQVMRSDEYSECCVVYGTASDNAPSNRLAKRIGLPLLGTKYRYGR